MIAPRTRREFIRDGIGLAALTATVPTFLSRTAYALEGKASPRHDQRILVVIQLSGGNDGLNTIVPYADDAYHRARPTIRVTDDKLLKIHDDIGLHVALAPLQALYDAGGLAIIQGVGYPNPDRSHFRSMEIWQTAEPDDYGATGWIGRIFDHTCGNAGCSPTAAVCIGQTLEPPLIGDSPTGIALTDPEQLYKMTELTGRQLAESAPPAGDTQIDFLRRTALDAMASARQIRDASRAGRPQVDYPQTALGRQMATVASLIAGGMDTRVYYVSQDGYDTHANQANSHERLLGEFAGAVSAFQRDLQKRGFGDRVLGMVFSEFGRRVQENGTGGTDHGQAAPMFLFGQPAKGGLHGDHPSLSQLAKGDLRFGIDFRRVYATVIQDWLGVPAAQVLTEVNQPLPLLHV